ncbi:hypothetical protein [Corallococcus carmarthensis]|uniref:Uncharacterized protein n=1 Tax=Corallococcus carmarthensis TaxID=2316728 RepID=A0A3A8KFY6_9BACT|nr:hypothetical protein [Corallococcus carmarthensis]NOK19720.1 hypothetical protein [Corallococcus carmarthensis]RKH07108.1 hypothetical protein D7X32_03285 [Corallococcus carmarthensis]
MRKLGYGLLITTGLLFGPLAGAQDTHQTPSPERQTNAPAQQQSGCPCGMMGSGMMGHGMGGAGMSCPMHGMADVKVEQTQTGAILRLTAKNPGQVAEVQRMAEGMQRCMSASGTPQQGQPSSPGQQQR